MADIDNPITGKDVRVQLFVDGALQQVQDNIIRFEETPVYDEIQTKHLGKSGSTIDKVFTHWEGSFEAANSRKEIEQIIDAVTAARIARVPVLVNIVRSNTYRDGTSKSHTYLDCKLEFSTTTARGESQSSTVSWKTGVDRISLN